MCMVLWYNMNMKRTGALRWVAGKETPDKVYITRVFNFGTREEWKQLQKKYTRRDIEKSLRNPLRGQWTKRGKAFAEVIYGIRLPDAVLISYDA